MKVASAIRTFLRVASLVVLGASGAFAQSEIAPDHFELSNTEPFRQAKVVGDGQAGAIRYDGTFMLPYAVQCNGKRLRPGKYSVSLRSDGKVGQVRLNQKGEAIGIAGIVRDQAHKQGNDALLVESNGKTRTLSAIQIAQFELAFDRKPHTENSPDKKAKWITRLLLTKRGSQSAEPGASRANQ